MAAFTPVGVTALVEGFGKFQSDLKSMGKSISDTGGFAAGVKSQFLGLGDSVLSLGKTAAMVAAGGIAALGAGLTAIVATSVGVAARVSEMDRVVHFLGETHGFTTQQVDDFVQSIVEEGVRLDVAQQVAAQAIRRNMDFAQVLDLVKVAQGGAIMANEDSSDTLWALMDAITTNNVLMLRRRGITVDATVAYEDYVKAQKGGTQATVDNSAAIADQTQKIGFLERDMVKLTDNYHEANAQLIHANEIYPEGGEVVDKWADAVRDAQLAIDKKAATIDKARGKLGELETAHGTASDAIKVTTDDLTGEERSAAFLNAVLKDGEKLIPLYAEAMKEPGKRARSLKRDIFDLRMEIGTPFLDAFGAGVDALRDFVKQVTAAIAEGGALRPVIEGIAEVATSVITKILGLASQVATLALAGDFEGILGMLGLGPEAMTLIDNVLGELGALAQIIIGTVGPALQFIADNAMPALIQALAFVNEHWEAFKGALIGVGVVLAGAAIAALVVGIGAAIAGLLSPINLIIAAAALLGMIWKTNWMGIRDAVIDAWENKIRPALERLQEWLQTEIPFALQTTSNYWRDVLWPALEQLGQFIAEKVIPTLADLVVWFLDNIPVAIQATASFWTETLQPALMQVWQFVQTSLIPTLLDIWTWLQVNIPAAIQAVSSFWNDVFLASIYNVSSFITDTLIPTFFAVVDWLSVQITTAIAIVRAEWDEFVAILSNVWAFINDYILPVFAAVANVLDAVLGLALTAAAGLWQNVLQPALQTVWDFLDQKILPIFQRTAEGAEATVGGATEVLAAIWETRLKPALETIWSYIQENIIPIFELAGEVIETVLGAALVWLVDTVLIKVQTAFDNIKLILVAVETALNSMAGAITSIELPDWLTPGSITPFEEGLIGIGNAVLETLLPAFTTFMTWLFEQWTLFQEQWVAGNELIVLTWTTTMTTLQTTLVTFVAVALAELQKLLAKFNEIVAAIEQMTAKLAEAKKALEELISDEIKSDLDDLLDRVERLAKKFENLADAIKEAAKEAAEAGAGGGAAPAEGFQRGGAFTVPASIGPEGVPIRVHRLERVSIIPAGQAAAAGSATEYNFNLNVSTRDTAAATIREFEIMRALI